LEAWWNVVNWIVVEQRFQKAKLLAAKKKPKVGIRKQYGI
jgi:hypothetical protein